MLHILAALGCLLLHLPLSIHADSPPYLADPSYDRGAYGSYPSQSFLSSDLIAPRLNVLKDSPKCQDGLFIFMAPRGKALTSTPMILDSHRNLVWSTKEYDNVYNLRVQRYQGENFITFWSGEDQVRGHGAGEYYMLDSSYQEVRRIRAGNGLPGDLHEFLFTDNGTALLTIYEPTTADLTPVGGPADGHIYDSLFQEIDVQSEEVIFQWRASDYYNFTEAFHDITNEGTESKLWDWFHINSVEKDDAGNYLISARYTHTITYINGRTGEILWTFGGQRNQFSDLSSGKASNFAGQHDARWQDELAQKAPDGHLVRRGITLFDNGGDYDLQVSDESRGMKVVLDFEKMTVELIEEYINPDKILSYSQGNLQSLPNGDVLVGYGFNGIFTEFSNRGEVLCNVHFQPWSGYNSGDVQSYRIYKQAWRGRPKTKPAITLWGNEAYVSWNGATHVRWWVTQASDEREDTGSNFRRVELLRKEGFETPIKIDRKKIPEQWIRVVAIDERNRTLGMTKAMDLYADQMSIFDRLYVLWRRHRKNAIVVVPIIISAFAVLLMIVRKLFIRRACRKTYQYSLI